MVAILGVLRVIGGGLFLLVVDLVGRTSIVSRVIVTEGEGGSELEGFKVPFLAYWGGHGCERL